MQEQKWVHREVRAVMSTLRKRRYGFNQGQDFSHNAVRSVDVIGRYLVPDFGQIKYRFRMQRKPVCHWRLRNASDVA